MFKKLSRWLQRFNRTSLCDAEADEIARELAALMEDSYLASGHSVFFFLELLQVYEAGHFPCGWIGEWPNGELVAY